MQRFSGELEARPFDSFARRMRSIFTTVGRYSTEAVVNSGDTCEVPIDEASCCLVFDEEQ